MEEEKMKKVKTLTIILIIILLTMVAFFGIYTQVQNRMENQVKNYELAMDLKGARNIRLKVSEQTNEVIKDAEGNVVDITVEDIGLEAFTLYISLLVEHCLHLCVACVLKLYAYAGRSVDICALGCFIGFSVDCKLSAAVNDVYKALNALFLGPGACCAAAGLSCQNVLGKACAVFRRCKD